MASANTREQDVSKNTKANTPESEANAPLSGVNLAVLRGRLSRAPREVELPSGDRLARLDVTVRRPDATETVPVQVDDPNATVLGLTTGSEIVVIGVVRRRYYRAGGATASQTEVVADRVIPASHRGRVATAVERALASTATSFGDAS